MQTVKKEEIRVLHLISSSGFLGAENVVLELAKQSRSAGNWTTIGIFENQHNPHLELAEATAAEGLNVQIFPCRGRFDKKTIRMIKDYLSKENIEILHSHNYKSNFYARMALSDNNIRWVVTNHGRRTGSILLFYNFLDFFILRQADRVIAVSQKIARRMKLAGIETKRICVIDNWINVDRFVGKTAAKSTRDSLGIKTDALVIGTVGSLTEEKEHAYVLQATPKVIASFPEAVFLFVGDGRERDRLENISCKLGIRDQLIFAGTRKDIPEILSILDVFVLPSLKEGLPMALLEAQAAKVPTVATRVGAIPNVVKVKDGATGILVPPKDSEAIGQAIIRILADRTAVAEMTKRGFDSVRNNFSSERMADKYLSLYIELLNGWHNICNE